MLSQNLIASLSTLCNFRPNDPVPLELKTEAPAFAIKLIKKSEPIASYWQTEKFALNVFYRALYTRGPQKVGRDTFHPGSRKNFNLHFTFAVLIKQNKCNHLLF